MSHFIALAIKYHARDSHTHGKSYSHESQTLSFCLYVCTAVLPRITSHPQEVKYAVPGKPVIFTIQATGTEPLRYQWQWKPAEEKESGSEEWQLCDVESTSLTITSVQKSDEGSYRCVVSNIAGSYASEPAKLSIGKHPHLSGFL